MYTVYGISLLWIEKSCFPPLTLDATRCSWMCPSFGNFTVGSFMMVGSVVATADWDCAVECTCWRSLHSRWWGLSRLSVTLNLGNVQVVICLVDRNELRNFILSSISRTISGYKEAASWNFVVEKYLTNHFFRILQFLLHFSFAVFLLLYASVSIDRFHYLLIYLSWK